MVTDFNATNRANHVIKFLTTKSAIQYCYIYSTLEVLFYLLLS